VSTEGDRIFIDRQVDHPLYIVLQIALLPKLLARKQSVSIRVLLAWSTEDSPKEPM
jgi:hypothetical protein